METSLEKIRKEIRSILDASANAMRLKEINRDYQMFHPQSLAVRLRELKYRSLEDLLRDMEKAGDVTLSNDNGFMMVRSCYNSKTAHIKTMVAEQRNSKGSGSGSRRHGGSRASRIPPPMKPFPRSTGSISRSSAGARSSQQLSTQSVGNSSRGSQQFSTQSAGMGKQDVRFRTGTHNVRPLMVIEPPALSSAVSTINTAQLASLPADRSRSRTIANTGDFWRSSQSSSPENVQLVQDLLNIRQAASNYNARISAESHAAAFQRAQSRGGGSQQRTSNTTRSASQAVRSRTSSTDVSPLCNFNSSAGQSAGRSTPSGPEPKFLTSARDTNLSVSRASCIGRGSNIADIPSPAFAKPMGLGRGAAILRNSTPGVTQPKGLGRGAAILANMTAASEQATVAPASASQSARNGSPFGLPLQLQQDAEREKLRGRSLPIDVQQKVREVLLHCKTGVMSSLFQSVYLRYHQLNFNPTTLGFKGVIDAVRTLGDMITLTKQENSCAVLIQLTDIRQNEERQGNVSGGGFGEGGFGEGGFGEGGLGEGDFRNGGFGERGFGKGGFGEGDFGDGGFGENSNHTLRNAALSITREEFEEDLKELIETYPAGELALKDIPSAYSRYYQRLPPTIQFGAVDMSDLVRSCPWVKLVSPRSSTSAATCAPSVDDCIVTIMEGCTLYKAEATADQQDMISGRRLLDCVDCLAYNPPPYPEGSDGERGNEGEEYVDVILAHVYSPSHFFFQMEKFHQVLENLMDEMQLYYNHQMSQNVVLPGDKLRVGQVCVALYAGALLPGDRQWHRAQITSVGSHQVGVNFVDYGTLSVCSIKDLKGLKQTFYDFPRQAIPAYLNNVQVREGEGGVESGALACMMELVRDRVLVATIAQEWEGTYGIELVDTNSATDINVEEELVKAGFCVYAHTEEDVVPAYASSNVSEEVSLLNAGADVQSLFVPIKPAQLMSSSHCVAGAAAQVCRVAPFGQRDNEPENCVRRVFITPSKAIHTVQFGDHIMITQAELASYIWGEENYEGRLMRESAKRRTVFPSLHVTPDVYSESDTLFRQLESYGVGIRPQQVYLHDVKDIPRALTLFGCPDREFMEGVEVYLNRID